MKNSSLHSVIMAGGVGSRFWPLSKNNKPKQFLDILGSGKSFIQITYSRLLELSEPKNIWIVTHQDYADLVREHLPNIPVSNILVEPERKNTAPCIAYAASVIHQMDPNSIMLIAPADHLILSENQFSKDIHESVQFLQQQNSLITLGIQPSRPDTGYGYIQRSPDISYEFEMFPVKKFVEKPNHNTALSYMNDGNYFWNAGIFIWKSQTILEELKLHYPEIYNLFTLPFLTLQHKIKEIYARCPSISIDYAVMEKSLNVFVKSVDFGWSDLGTWGSLYENLPHDSNGNAIQGDKIVANNSSQCMIKNADTRIVALESVQNLIVINTPDAVLICNKDEEQKIKQLIAQFPSLGLENTL